MDDTQFAALSTWITEAGLAGLTETDLVAGFCERLAATGVKLTRAGVFIDTLHPIHEGRIFRWERDSPETKLIEYGRTQTDDQVDRWHRSPFYHMLQTGDSVLRRRLTAEGEGEFGIFPELRAAGMTEYLAIITRFTADHSIGNMDCVYSSWMTNAEHGFRADDVADLQRLMPFLALAVKSVSLARVAGTLVETYLGRDAGKRVLSGRIERGVTDRIEAVLWFSDLRGYTRISDTAAPEQIIPLLNDYADAVIAAIHAQGGDVLKLMGDGTLAIFTGSDQALACRAAVDAATAARLNIATLNQRRASENLPVTDMYLGLHVGEVFYGNIGSTERLDFTVVGPAVNEVSRIASMCRSVDQWILISSAFAAAIGEAKSRLVSVGRYALRGVGRPQDLYTLDAEAPAAPIRRSTTA
jgi:adenylate cyclase